MVLRPLDLRRNNTGKRSRACRPGIERVEPRIVLSPPTVTGLSPTSGLEAGGTLVTISGTSFTGATVVDFGTTAATNLSLVNDTTLTADSPAGTGVVNVTVTAPGGTSAATPADEFTYTVPSAPTVTGLSPTNGLTTGGTLVTITGTSFTGATTVDFGTTAATNLTVVNDTTLTADSPAGTGTVAVTVTTPVGAVGHVTSRSVHVHGLCDTDGNRTEPDQRYGGRRYSGYGYRNRIYRCHGGRLWDDGGDESHSRERHHAHSRQPGGNWRRECDRDVPGGHVGRHTCR